MLYLMSIELYEISKVNSFRLYNGKLMESIL